MVWSGPSEHQKLNLACRAWKSSPCHRPDLQLSPHQEDSPSAGGEDAAALGDAGSDAGDAADGVGVPVPVAAPAEGASDSCLVPQVLALLHTDLPLSCAKVLAVKLELRSVGHTCLTPLARPLAAMALATLCGSSSMHIMACVGMHPTDFREDVKRQI